MGRLNGEVVGSVVGGLKQPSIFGCSLGWELRRYTVLILDFVLIVLIEPLLSLVFSSLSSTIRELSKVY